VEGCSSAHREGWLMPYRRAGRPTWSFQARTRTGWRQLSTRTPDRKLAEKIEAMWEALALDNRAWDLLEPVLQGQLTVGALFDFWRDANRSVEALRRLLNDVDLEPLVADFLAVHKAKVKADSLRHIEVHLRALLPDTVVFPRSAATVHTLTTKLYAYTVRDADEDEGIAAVGASAGTIRKVHSDWSVFFAYCTDVRGLFERNPMERVARPPAAKPLVRFYELDTVERIIAWQPSAERRALFALLYGTGIEISVALTLTRADVDESRKEVRAAGTKTHTRDRMARVADWAWANVWGYAKALLPGAKLFPGVPSRYTASDWHALAVGAKGLGLTAAYPMYNARHHWAVRQLRAGAPIKLVQEQLGHASPTLTLNTYGQFRPSGQDRDRWEQAATDYETERREAK
jgi:integrase